MAEQDALTPLAGPDTAGLTILNQQIEGCRLCAERGFVAIPRPIDRGGGTKQIWLIGQAPGFGEGTRKLAFGGPAGRTLMRWFETVGLSETQVRDYCYLSAITKCYPGRANGGGGDRNPAPLERALCRPYLLQELILVQPKILILVGSTSIKEVYGDKIRLEEIIGRHHTMTHHELYDRLTVRLTRAKEPLPPTEWKTRLDPQATIEVYHLPHPSGASTWLNFPQNKALLEQALHDLKQQLTAYL